jgi:hypothetical protein
VIKREDVRVEHNGETAATEGKRLKRIVQQTRNSPWPAPHVRRANSRPRATGALAQFQGQPCVAASSVGLLLGLAARGPSQRLMPEIEPEMAMKNASNGASNFGGMGANSTETAMGLPAWKGPPAQTRHATLAKSRPIIPRLKHMPCRTTSHAPRAAAKQLSFVQLSGI